MGVYLVNGENLNAEATGFNRGIWNTLCCASFILIWNSYPKTANKNLVYAGRVIGFIVLIVLAFVYRGGEEGEIQQFGTWWWGILVLSAGLIWSRVVSVLCQRTIFAAIFGAWVFFAILSMDIARGPASPLSQFYSRRDKRRHAYRPHHWRGLDSTYFQLLQKQK
jgi:FtsH-binding integral membrane protein